MPSRHKLSDLLAVFAVFAVLSGGAFTPEARAQSGGFEAPVGTVDLLPSDEHRTSLALIDFFSPLREKALKEGALQLIEQEMMFRPGFEGKYDVMAREDFLEMAAKELKGKTLDPLNLPLLKNLISVDYLVFVDERLVGRKWVWRARLYNGRSGAFVQAVESVYRPYHLRWTVDVLLGGIQAITEGKEPPQTLAPPKALLLERAVKALADLKPDCLKGQCVKHLDEFEWLQENNPDFYFFLMRNPLYINALQREASTPIQFARISFLESNPMEVSLKLENGLRDVRSTRARITYLTYIGRAAIELSRPEKANEAFDELARLDRFNLFAQYGKAWVQKAKNNPREAITLLESLLARHPMHRPSIELLLSVYGMANMSEMAWPYKARLAQIMTASGENMAANELYLELLDHEFDGRWLKAIIIPLLSPVNRKNLATMLNQHGVVHDENEVDVFMRLAELKIEEGRLEEAGRVLHGALQLTPDRVDLIELVIGYEIDHGKDWNRASELLARLPKTRRDPLLVARLYEVLGKPKLAAQAWNPGNFPTAWMYETRLIQTAWLLKLEKLDEAERLAKADLEIYRSRADLQQRLVALYNALKKPEQARAHQAAVWQLEGKPFDAGRYKADILAEYYDSLVLPQPLVGAGQTGNIRSVGKVVVLDGTALVPEKNWQDMLADTFELYVPRKPARIVDEMREVLSERYDVVDNIAAELEFRKRLHERHPKTQTRFSKNELMELSHTLGADSLFVIRPIEDRQLEDGLVDVNAELYFYDSVANSVYRTTAKLTVPFFTLYRFNIYLIGIPVVVALFLLLLLTRFRRMTRHLQNPMMHAEFLIRQRNYNKAADILEKNGYVRDSMSVRAHHWAKQQDYAKAFEAFYHAKDYENAELALAACPDTEEVNTLAAELYFQQREYDRAETFYRKTQNLLGIAKVYEARGKPKKAARIRGQYYFERNNPVAAIEEYRRVSDYERAGFVFFYHGKYKEAALMFKQGNNDEMYRKSMLRMGARPKA